MPQLKTDPALRPFSETGYEILDEELETRREVAIWSVDPLTPKLGDLFTVVPKLKEHIQRAMGGK